MATRDRVVQRHHRVVRHALEQAVQRQDLRPVGVLGARASSCTRRNRRLQLVRPDRPARQRRGHQRHALGDGAAVPQRPVLLVERDRARRRDPCAPGAARRSAASARATPRPPRRPAAARCTARVRRIASPDRSTRCKLGARAARVALVEDQVEHVQHGAQPLGALSAAGSPNRTPEALDALLRPADPLRHRRLRHEERAARSPRSSARRRRAA